LVENLHRLTKIFCKFNLLPKWWIVGRKVEDFWMV